MSTEGILASREDKNEAAEFSAEDLAKIFHYPSIGQLFSDPTSAASDDFKSRMVSTRDELEKIVRHGSREDADKAGIVINGINVTIDFLSSLQRMRAGQNRER
jgi:hypothetical protein